MMKYKSSSLPRPLPNTVPFWFTPSAIYPNVVFLKINQRKKWKVLKSPLLTHVDNRTATWSKRHEMLHAFGWGWSFFIQVSQTSGHHNDHSVFGPLVSRRDPWIWKRVKNNNNNKERGKKFNEKWKNHNLKKKFHLINFTI